MERVRTLHNEIKGLRTELEDRRIEHDREKRQLDSAAPYGDEYNRRTYKASQGRYGQGNGRGGGMGGGHGGGQY